MQQIVVFGDIHANLPALEATFADSVFFVERGMVGVLLRSGTRVATLGAGTWFGELALLSPGAPRSADVVADSRTTCLRLALDALDRLRATDAAITERVFANLAALLAERLRKANAKMEVLSRGWSTRPAQHEADAERTAGRGDDPAGAGLEEAAEPRRTASGARTAGAG